MGVWWIMKKFTVESGAGEQGTDELSYKYKKDTPGQSSNGKTMKEKQSDTNLDIKSLEKLIKGQNRPQKGQRDQQMPFKAIKGQNFKNL